jgi:hypothetical protein
MACGKGRSKLWHGTLNLSFRPSVLPSILLPPFHPHFPPFLPSFLPSILQPPSLPHFPPSFLPSFRSCIYLPPVLIPLHFSLPPLPLVESFFL